jgi:hypothetical protein
VGPDNFLFSSSLEKIVTYRCLGSVAMIMSHSRPYLLMSARDWFPLNAKKLGEKQIVTGGRPNRP